MGALGGIADPFPEFVAFSAGLAALDGRALVRDGKLGRTNDPRLRQYLRVAAELEVLVNFTDEPVEVPGLSGRWVGGTARPGETPGPGQGLGPDEARILDPRG